LGGTQFNAVPSLGNIAGCLARGGALRDLMCMVFRSRLNTRIVTGIGLHADPVSRCETDGPVGPASKRVVSATEVRDAKERRQ